MNKIIMMLMGAVLISGTAQADNSWSDYHWARTTSSFDLTIINSTLSSWDSYVVQATADWSNSAKLNMVEENGSTSRSTRRRCRASSGTVRICNNTYGNTGWLGVAGISLDSNGHITSGYTKLNDTYFSQSFYNNFSWKQSVTCQELGHNVGLNHQDEDFNNQSLFSCMDYQNPPYEYPNTHDYEQLETIYGHTDSYNSYSLTGASEAPGANNNRAQGWGQSTGRHHNLETFVRRDLDGTVHITKVTWALGF